MFMRNVGLMLTLMAMGMLLGWLVLFLLSGIPLGVGSFDRFGTPSAPHYDQHTTHETLGEKVL